MHTITRCLRSIFVFQQKIEGSVIGFRKLYGSKILQAEDPDLKGNRIGGHESR